VVLVLQKQVVLTTPRSGDNGSDGDAGEKLDTNIRESEGGRY